MKLGAICDDFTGSSDLGLTLKQGGMRTVQFVGVPREPASADVEAGLVSLKTRSAPVADAVRQSVDAWRWLSAQGCEQFLFKYCSTFDSTPEGNIGPVIDALIEATGTTDPVIVCPAFPATGRTIYQGHLFVGDRLLSETGMRHHPITPMTDPDLRRWLGLQTRRPIGHLPLARLRAGGIRDALLAEAAAGRQIVVCDAIDDEDLRELGRAAAGFSLVTGGSGIALALPDGYVGLVHPRSGLAHRHGLSIVNAPGTVDAGYRGEVQVCLVNLDPATPVELRRGDRIAQLVIQRVETATFVEVDALPGSARGAGGHGSTGGF